MDILKYVRKKQPQRKNLAAKIFPCPYTNSKQIWNTHTGSIIASRGYWQIVGVLCLLITLCAIAGVVYIGSQTKFVPYVVEVDKLGQPMAVAPASKAKKVDQRVVRSTLSQWISNIRMVTPDIALQRKAILDVYAHLSIQDPATFKANEWLNSSEEQTPFNKAKNKTVHVEVDSVIAQTPDTWQVDWTEKERDRHGKMLRNPISMRALIKVYVAPPTPEITEQQIRENPLGLFVEDFNWSEQL